MKFRTLLSSKPRTLLPANFCRAGVDSGMSPLLQSPEPSGFFCSYLIAIHHLVSKLQVATSYQKNIHQISHGYQSRSHLLSDSFLLGFRYPIAIFRE